MRRSLLAVIPVLGLTVILQIAIVSRMVLLSGNADVILLVLAAWALQERTRGSWIWGVCASLLVGLVSGIPWYIYLAAYLIVVGAARLLIHRIWQAPLLAMFAVTFTGTLALLILTYFQRLFTGVTLSPGDVLLQILLPSLLLNLLLAIPVHALIKDLANRMYPAEVIA
jgi:hypothetical protein